MVAKNFEWAGERQKRLYNRGKRHIEYNVGDEVMRRVHALSDASKRFNVELDPKYEGIFTTAEKKYSTVYIFDSKERGSKSLAMIHVSELKCYVPPRGVSVRSNAHLTVSDPTWRVDDGVELQDQGERVRQKDGLSEADTEEFAASPLHEKSGPTGERIKLNDNLSDAETDEFAPPYAGGGSNGE